jgi:photosystem II stability/assembly factor-like uncharacterized protein
MASSKTSKPAPGTGWKQIGVPALSACSALVSAPTGTALLVSGKDLLRSTDQGSTWERIKVRGVHGYLSRGVGLPDGRWYVVGGGGKLFVSGDDGFTWAVRSCGTSGGLSDVWTDGAHVFAVGGGEEPVAVRSTDGGTSFTRCYLPPGKAFTSLLRIIQRGPDSFLAMGSPPLVSSDAGKTWSPSQTEACYCSATLVAPQTWVAVGLLGALGRSTDGGQTWDALKKPVKTSLRDVVAVPDGALIACGDKGTVIRSGDRGLTWTREDSGVSTDLAALWVAADRLWAVGLAGTVISRPLV